MKKLLHHWCKVEFRLQQRNKLSKRMISAAKYLPSEFSRKSRSISELPRYKATEFRLFLLYLGPILLKKILPNILYNHFLLLHAAMRILLHNKLHLDVEWLNKAREMLIQFVNDSSILYGREYSIYNVHNLVHITDDVQNLKYSLEELSCFPFENYLGKLISMLRRWNKPLAQVIRRLSENGAPTIKEISRKICVEYDKKKIHLPCFNIKAYGLRDSYIFGFTMSSKRRVMKKRNMIPHDSDSDSESDDIQQPQTVAPNKDVDDTTSFTKEQLALLNHQYVEIKYEINQIFKKLEGIERLLNNIAINVNNTPQNTFYYGEERSFLDQLPLKSVAEITNFDTTIAKSFEKFNLLILYDHVILERNGKE
ncbi:uncharacterized protein LOC143341998 [Colletes latitarsis]|uniref:uncharacterized protein LOC143341998 n=1 Tax=Colletes latitarsis TaxID=2605962 RepID=UPI004035FFD8